MKIFLYVVLWGLIFVFAVTIRYFLGHFLAAAGAARVAAALVKSLPTGLLAGLGVFLQQKIARWHAGYRQKKPTTK